MKTGLIMEGGGMRGMFTAEDLNISRAAKDPNELKRVYEIRRKVVEQQLDVIKEFLKKES